MPWKRMRLRGARVLARCSPDGSLVAESGRVEIRYKPDDGRAYRAAVSNLTPDASAEILPDDHCGSAEPAADRTRRATQSEPKPPEAPEGNEILAFADGACSGNPGPAGLGVVMLWDDRRRELSEFLGEGTNNIAELTAILRTLEANAELDRPLRLYTDSQYAIGVLTKGWKAKANKELIAEIRDVLGRASDVELFHVRGHQGIPLNERADALAVQAVESRDTTGWLDA